METLVIEDRHGRYRVTVEADSALFADALKHDLAECVIGMASSAWFGSLIQSGPWPKELLGVLNGYARGMRNELLQGRPR